MAFFILTLLWGASFFLFTASENIFMPRIGSTLSIAAAYVLMGGLSVFLALRGNRMLSNQIQKENPSLGQDSKIRVVTAASQYKQIACGVLYKVFLYLPALVVGFGTFPHVELFLLTSFVIDALSLAAVLILAPRLHLEENEVCPGVDITADLIIKAPSCQQRSELEWLHFPRQKR